MAASAGTEWAKRFFADIRERQVNTIVADGISGRAMTHPLEGLLDIANTYRRELEDAGFGLIDQIKADYPQAVDAQRALRGNSAAFTALIKQANDALQASRPGNSKRVLYRRIIGTCSELRTITTKLEKQNEKLMGWNAGTEDPPKVEIQPEERAAITKAWELSTSTIAVQTTIGIDGDLVTRIAREQLGESGAVVRQLHTESVQTSLNTWESLVSGIMQLAKALIG